jgi:Trypsin
LIAPSVVVTAAHCLFDRFRESPFPVHDIHFLAGVYRDKNLGHSEAECLKFPPGFRPGNLSTDIATIVLAHPLAIDPIALAGPEPFRENRPLIHAAYPADRRYQLMADSTCKTLGRTSGVWATSCDSYAGSSGGPVLIHDDNQMLLAAIMVGVIGSETLAVPLEVWPGLPLGADCHWKRCGSRKLLAYRSASWRVMLNQAHYNKVVAYIRKLQARSTLWNATASIFLAAPFTRGRGRQRTVDWTMAPDINQAIDSELAVAKAKFGGNHFELCLEGSRGDTLSDEDLLTSCATSTNTFPPFPCPWSYHCFPSSRLRAEWCQRMPAFFYRFSQLCRHA